MNGHKARTEVSAPSQVQEPEGPLERRLELPSAGWRHVCTLHRTPARTRVASSRALCRVFSARGLREEDCPSAP